jgi:hypothetical protein
MDGMSARKVQVVVVCEDAQHEAFLRRILSGLGYERRKIRVEKSDRGAANAWVLQQVPNLLRVYRTGHVEHIVVVMIDTDERTLEDRLRQVDDACRAQGIEPRKPEERVAVLLPQRNIETWLAYLDGEDVDETSTYPRLEFASDCQRHVDTLLEGCQKGRLRPPTPRSLELACQDYRTRIRRR